MGLTPSQDPVPFNAPNIKMTATSAPLVREIPGYTPVQITRRNSRSSSGVSLEEHEDETDGKTNADEHEQHKQKHVNASFEPLKSMSTVIHCLR